MNPGSSTKSSRCGCPSADPAAFPSWSPAKAHHDCGCGKNCRGGGGSAGGCSCGSGKTANNAEGTCTSGTSEATHRAGIMTGGCLSPRARFFPGELVTDSDLTAAVDYHRSQQLLSNGVIGGWGVYCGFSLCLDEGSCTVCVGPGIAVDARGRTIVHDGTICIKRPDPSQLDPKAICDPCAKQPDEDLFLAIVYDDCLDGAKPRYGSVCGPGPDPGCDFSRVRERGRLVWIRDIDESYWTSGCLADPCADPVGEPERECGPGLPDFEDLDEPTLDECTPCIGIRGGKGVELYARQLDARWALSRNVRLLTDPNHASNCSLGVATLVDVISGTACDACSGEAVVVLGRVHFGTSAQGQPTIAVSPRRRRVLSNANLTYLVEWLMEYVVCNLRATNAKPEEEPPPPSTATCNDPCLDEKTVVEEIARAAVGNDGTHLVAAQSRAAWHVTFERMVNPAMFDRRAFLDVVAAAYGPLARKKEEGALKRYYQLVGRLGREEAIRRGVVFLYPRGLPEDKRSDVEDAVYAFLNRHRIDELGTATAPTVIQLAQSINTDILQRGAYPRDQVERLAKVLPRGVTSAEEEMAALRARVRELEQRVEKAGVADEDGTVRTDPAVTEKPRAESRSDSQRKKDK